MSRRDLVIYILIAVFGVGAAAVVSAVTMTRGTATPYLLWFGLSAVFVSAIGLIVMLVNGGTTVAPGGALIPRPQLSANGAYVAYMLICIGIPSSGLVAVNIANAFKSAPRASAIIYARPSLRGAVTGDLSNPAVLSSALIGKPQDVSGILVEVHENSIHTGGAGLLTRPSDRTQVSVAFDTGELSSFSAGDHLYAQCKIEAASPRSLNLGGCEIISSDQWLTAK